MNMLVLARKYNDIFYAVSTKEWKECNLHYLILQTSSINKDDYPLLELFDEIYCVKTSYSTLGYLKQCLIIKNIVRRLDYQVASISNAIMTSSMCVIEPRKVRTVILLEDGLMNYYDFKPSQRFLKKLLQKILFISDQKCLNKIKKTYLLSPQEAKYYHGEKVQLSLDKELILKHIEIDQSLNNSSVFVGDDCYLRDRITVAEYCEFVNRFIKEHNIDFYMPHYGDHSMEVIDSPELKLSKVTLEILSGLLDLKIYSFQSSVLFTTKLLNKKVLTYAVRDSRINHLPEDSIIYRYVDGIIKC